MVTKPHPVGVRGSLSASTWGQGSAAKAPSVIPARRSQHEGVVNLPPAVCGTDMHVPLTGPQSPGHPGSSVRVRGPPSLQDVTGTSPAGPSPTRGDLCL